MTDIEWTSSIGLRRAAVSLVWRGVLTLVLWCGALWSFHAAIAGIGLTTVPFLITAGFSLLCGSIAGTILSRKLDEVAGFVSPLLTLFAVIAATGAIVGGEAIFASQFDVATDHLRYLIVGMTMLVTVIWIGRATMFEG